ncbi:MAG: helix-hairpin-helix domain-containing protein, partial [Myxococcota bacterium]
RDKQREAGAAKTAVDKLQQSLHLRKKPERIECYDISHFQGGQIVGSAVRFERGMPQKDLYRIYKIRSTDGQQDDFKSMYELISRRARRGLEEGELPDLMVIDGGKGQLAAARAALDDHGVDEVELISLAKSRTQDDRKGPGPSLAKEVSRSSERVFRDGLQDPIVLRQNSAELFLLARVRDEAHRFAITHQRKLQRKASTKTVLDDIPGVGEKRRQALLRSFGSVARIKEASQEALAEVVGKKTAEAVHAALAGPGD